MRSSRVLATTVVAGALSLGMAGTAQAEADRDCGDFMSQPEAQAFYTAQGGPATDPHRLDRDNDGEACEDHDYSGTDRSQATTINSGIPAAPGTPVGLIGGTLLVLAGAGVAVRAARS